MDFDAAYARYHLLVWRRCRRLIACAEDAEEAAASVWVSAWRHRARMAGKDDEDVVRWLMRLTHNQCIDHYRHERARVQIVGEVGAWVPDRCDVEHAYLVSERVHEVDAALGAVDERLRGALVLQAFGYDWNDGGALMGVGHETFHTRVNKARAKLRKRVA